MRKRIAISLALILVMSLIIVNPLSANDTHALSLNLSYSECCDTSKFDTAQAVSMEVFNKLVNSFGECNIPQYFDYTNINEFICTNEGNVNELGIEILSAGTCSICRSSLQTMFEYYSIVSRCFDHWNINQTLCYVTNIYRHTMTFCSRFGCSREHTFNWVLIRAVHQPVMR